jgi:hypothetical protein
MITGIGRGTVLSPLTSGTSSTLHCPVGLQLQRTHLETGGREAPRLWVSGNAQRLAIRLRQPRAPVNRHASFSWDLDRNVQRQCGSVKRQTATRHRRPETSVDSRSSLEYILTKRQPNAQAPYQLSLISYLGQQGSVMTRVASAKRSVRLSNIIFCFVCARPVSLEISSRRYSNTDLRLWILNRPRRL